MSNFTPPPLRLAAWLPVVCLSIASTIVQANDVPVRLPQLLTAASEAEASLSPPSASDATDATDDSRQQIHRRLERVKRMVEQQGNSPSPALVSELELLRWLDLLYSGFETVRERYREVQEQASTTDDEATDSTDSSGPLSFIELDELRDELLAEHDRANSIQMQVDAARVALETARENLKQSDAQRRLLQESLSAERGAEKRAEIQRELELHKLTSEAYNVTVEQQQIEIKIKSLEQEINRKRRERLERRIADARRVARFSEADLQSRLENCDRAETDLDRVLARIQARLLEANRNCRVVKLRRQRDDSDPESNTAEFHAWQKTRELRQEQLAFFKQLSAYTGLVRNMWRRRFELANGMAAQEDIYAWKSDLANCRTELAGFQRLLQIRSNEYLDDAVTLKKRLMAARGEPTPETPWLQLQVNEIDEVLSQYMTASVMLRTADRLFQRFDEELDVLVEAKSMRQVLANLQQLAQAAWRYEITAVDDRPITVGKVVSGLVLCLLGIVTSRLLSRFIGRRLLPRIGLNIGAAQAYQSIVFYLMVTCFGFLSLEMINVPLTVFAFMGGAVAIGVGFGSQNILNNFISGLIVLAERPVRVGDLVEIGGLTGTIEHIGARSTRVKTGSNLEIIVPNSSFLENNVTNWTLSDNRIRVMVSVGVAYGSPTSDVSRLLSETVQQHARVLQQPEPVVLFKEFGDNALLFEVHFWVHMQTMMQAEVISSEIRHDIDRRFAQAEITIAYPQRDVHLDTLAPIEVHLRQVAADNAPVRVRPAA